jgi:hypothetical protein
VGEVAQKPADGDAPTDEALVSGSDWSRQQQPARCFASPGRSDLDEAEALDLVNGPRVCLVRQLRMQDRADPVGWTASSRRERRSGRSAIAPAMRLTYA